VKVGIVLPIDQPEGAAAPPAYPQIRAVAQAAEAAGLDSLWVFDHLLFRFDGQTTGIHECWTILAAIAEATTRVELGSIVMCTAFRNPALLAKMAATTDIIAGGRLDFGIGAGGSRIAGPNPAVREFGAYGVPLVSPGEAVRDLAQTCTLIRRMWTEDQPFGFRGPSIELTGAVCEPKPLQKPHPPIMIGGSGDQVLRIVAEHADIWNYPGSPSDDFRRRNQVLDEHCAAIGRDPAGITRSMQTIVRCGEPQEPAATRAVLLEMIDAGVTHIVLAAVLAGRPVQWLADEIIEPVRAEAQHG